MIFLDVIQDFFNDKLNKAPTGKVFVMGQFIQQSDKNFRFVVNQSSVVQYNTSYISCMLIPNDTPQNIPNKDVYEWIYTIQFALSGENERTEPQLSERKAIDEFRKDLIDNPRNNVDVDGVNYDFTTTSYHISLFSDTIILSGKKRTIVSMQIAMQSGIDIFFGNDIKISLSLDGNTFTQLTKISSNHGRNKLASSAQMLTDNKVESVAVDSSYSYSVTVLYENNAVLNDIAKEIIGGGLNNKKYTMKTEFTPLGTIENKRVLLSGGVLNDKDGDYLTLAFNINEAFDG